MRDLWWLPGIALIFFGVLIFIFPELLAFIVATGFITVGMITLAAQKMMRRTFNTNSPRSYRIYRQDGGSPSGIYVE